MKTHFASGGELDKRWRRGVSTLLLLPDACRPVYVASSAPVCCRLPDPTVAVERAGDAALTDEPCIGCRDQPSWWCMFYKSDATGGICSVDFNGVFGLLMA